MALMIGYKAISPLYDPNTVENLRDTRYPFRFVEAVHGIGEWRSLHRIADISDVIWQYQLKTIGICADSYPIKITFQQLYPINLNQSKFNVRDRRVFW